MQFKSSALLMPISEDGQLTHQAVLAALSQGKHIPEENSRFCFKVTRSPEIYPMQLVQAKGIGLPEQCNPINKEICLIEDDFLTIKVDVSTSRSVTVFDSEKMPVHKENGKPLRKDIAISPTTKQFEHLLNTLMTSSGFKLVRIMAVGDFHRTNVKKTSSNFFIPHVEVELSVSVVNPELAEKALVLGIGKHRSYGFGFIDVLEHYSV